MLSSALAGRIGAGEALVAGVLSGTSADGIDVALARFGLFQGRLALKEVVAGETRPFPGNLATRVRAVLDGGPCDLRATALLDRDLGRAFGEAARAVAEAQGCALDLVASHGQTVYHHDDREPTGPATLQLGDGCHVAEAAGAPVVSDFRQRDVAAGGGGAPLSAYGDQVLFSVRPLAVLNLGGMANLTWLRAEGPPLAFDTGPAGALLDGLARRHLDRPFDAGGQAAACGALREEWVRAALSHPFFAAQPPKSTGRDTFGEEWVAALGWDGPAEDVLASAVEVVARPIAEAWARGPGPGSGPLAVAGGGWHNLALRHALERNLGHAPTSTEAHGVDPDLREALVFAALGALAARGEAVTAPETTGAAGGRILGKWSPGTR